MANIIHSVITRSIWGNEKTCQHNTHVGCSIPKPLEDAYSSGLGIEQWKIRNKIQQWLKPYRAI